MYCTLLLTSLLAALATSAPLESRATGEVVRRHAAVNQVKDNDGGAEHNRYNFFRGDGSTGAGWPAKTQWASFNSLWAANKQLMAISCGNNGWGADDTAAEIQHIRQAVEQQAKASKVDHRFILATIMQESVGCVRVKHTNNGVRNPGLMQSHNGAGDCEGRPVPCPQSEIHQMVKDGTSGTPSGDGLAATINHAEAHLGPNAQLGRVFYSAARLYNSGSINWQNLDDPKGATPCYASDIANRLLGWTLAPSTCTDS